MSPGIRGAPVWVGGLALFGAIGCLVVWQVRASEKGRAEVREKLEESKRKAAEFDRLNWATRKPDSDEAPVPPTHDLARWKFKAELNASELLKQLGPFLEQGEQQMAELQDLASQALEARYIMESRSLQGAEASQPVQIRRAPLCFWFVAEFRKRLLDGQQVPFDNWLQRRSDPLALRDW